MLKALATRKIAKSYNLMTNWSVFLPTGADTLIEKILDERGITDYDGYPIEIVIDHLTALAQAIIPIIGWFFYICWLCRYKRILYKYVIPLVFDDISDWLKLLYAILPFIFYIRILCIKED